MKFTIYYKYKQDTLQMYSELNMNILLGETTLPDKAS